MPQKRFPRPVPEIILKPVTWKWPWAYSDVGYGNIRNVVTCAEGRLIASEVRPQCGPMLAAGPALLTALWRVARMTRPDSPVHEVAVKAIEAHLEREGMQLDDVAPWEMPRRPRLRVVGVAT